MVEPGAFLYKDSSVTMEVEFQKLGTGLFGGTNMSLAQHDRARARRNSIHVRASSDRVGTHYVLHELRLLNPGWREFLQRRAANRGRQVRRPDAASGRATASAAAAALRAPRSRQPQSRHACRTARHNLPLVRRR